MRFTGKPGVFEAHATARAESLAGVALASFRRRLFAYLIDMGLVFGSYSPAMEALRHLLFDVLGIHETLYSSRQGRSHVQVDFRFDLLVELAWVLWLVLYFGLSVWKTNGWTLGKRLMGIRVVSLTHERMTLWQSVERAVSYGASALEGGFGFVQYFLYRNHQCVHDRIAETVVVRERRKKSAEP